ncbi:MAG: TraR/DksA C4-type zinc finger protein [Candidatus Paceibacterota bacterium]|jgi:RNA polymerase-binding transcription factor DksA
MNTKDIQYFKEKLLSEKKELEADLTEVGQKNPSNAQGWEATSTNIEVDTADENEVADKFEEYEGNSGILKQLENQLTEVNSALERITNGTYGNCEVCGKPIERERLEANPSSKISIKHAH